MIRTLLMAGVAAATLLAGPGLAHAQTPDTAALEARIAQLEAQLNLYRDMTLSSRPADLIVWPETAVPVLKEYAEGYLKVMGRVAAEHDAALITGVPLRQSNEHGEKRYYNAITVTGWGDIRGTGSTLVQQTLSTSGSTRTATKNPVDWSTNSGWFVDLPDTGERINVDMMLRYNTLVAGSNVPQSVASCTDTSTGYAWLYYLDIAFGSNTGTTVATKLSNSMLVGLGAYELSNGKGGVVVTYSNSDLDALNTPKPVTYLPTAKKSAWRELIDR